MSRRDVYPWDLYMNGEEHVLRHGVDFAVDSGSFYSAASQYAKRHGYALKAFAAGGTVRMSATMTVQPAIENMRRIRQDMAKAVACLALVREQGSGIPQEDKRRLIVLIEAVIDEAELLATEMEKAK